MGKYLGLYLSDAGEHLASLADDLVRLERATRAGDAPLAPIVDSMFRHAHSVKGMSSAMRFEGIAALAHQAEDLIDAVRGAGGRLEAGAADVLLAAVDALQAMVARVAGGSPPDADPALAARVASAAARIRGGPAGEAAPAPPVAPADPAQTSEPRQAMAGPPREVRDAIARRAVDVEVEVAGTCPVPAVRGYLVVKKLAGLGTVARSTPSLDELKAGRIPERRLAVVLETSEPLQAIDRALSQISDVSSVSVRERDEAVATSAPAEAAAAAEPPRTVRVRTELLDYFLDAVGELILATARLRVVGRSVPGAYRTALDEGVDRLHAIVKDLHDKVMAVRMTPLALVTERLPRAARDLARRGGKEVDVEVRGAEIELDRAILEELSDSLLHLLRNAIDHGIEPPHLRQLAGKPAAGRVTITARRERDRVILEIGDDGKGMDPEKLRAAAVARGVLEPDEAATLPDREALQLACLPGISTASAVTDVSGRGVGMDAVKRMVEEVGGALEIESARGSGTRVTLRLPLTVAVQPVLLVQVGQEVLGVPVAKVHGAAQVDVGALDRSRGEPLLAHGGELVPVHDLARLLGFDAAVGTAVRSVVVAEGDSGRVGLAVDALLGQEEAVLKPLARPLDLVPGLSAVTVLGNGRPVFILDVPRLLAA